MKGIIIYQGKYGATEQYAQWLAGSLHMTFLKAADVTPAMIGGYDLVILGSSVYVGKLVIREWLKRNLSTLTGKKLFLFIVSGTTTDDKIQQQQVLSTNLEPEIRKTIEVFFLPGRCVVGKLSWKDRFVLKMGAMLQRDPEKKAIMNQGFDKVDQKSLDSLIAAVGRGVQAGAVDGYALN
jgi:menaquinone-dependent protoporphyrinogen IX oxidase